MATLNKAYPFASSSEGFSGSSISGGTTSWDGTQGNPSGSLLTDADGRNKSGTAYWELTGTWEDLGISAGATIDQVRLNGVDTRCTEWNVVDSGSFGTVEIWNTDATVLIATLWSGRSCSGTEGSWTSTGNQSYQSIGSSYQASNTNVRIRINIDIDLANNANAAIEMLVDNFSFDIDYTESGYDIIGDDVTAGIPTVGNGVISFNAQISGNDVASGIPTVGDGTIYHGTFPLISKTFGNSGGTAGPTTSAAIDTTGADFLMVAVVYYAAGTAPTIADSKSNSDWDNTAIYDNADSSNVMIFFHTAPTVGSGHTFTITHPSTSYVSYFVYAFSGLSQNDLTVLDGGNGSGTNGSSYSTTYTPSIAGCLLASVYSVYSEDAIEPSPSGGFLLEDWDPYSGGVTPGGAVAFINDYDSTSQASVTWDVGDGDAVMIAAFQPPETGYDIPGDDVAAGIPTVGNGVISFNAQTVGDDVAAGDPTVSNETISFNALATGDDVATDAPTVSEGDISFNAEVVGDDVATDAPTVSEGTIQQNFQLLGDPVVAGIPTVSDSDINQEQNLDGDPVTSGVPTISEGTIQQDFNLLGDPVVAGVPTVSEGDISQTYQILGDSVTAGIPTVADGDISQQFELLGDPVVAGIPTVSDSDINQEQNIDGDPVTAGIPTVSEGDISQQFEILGDNVTSGVPTISEGEIDQVFSIPGDNVTSGIPTVSDSDISQEFLIGGDPVSAGIPTVSDGIVEFYYPISGSPVTAGIPTVSESLISQLFELLGDNVITGIPTVSDAIIVLGQLEYPLDRILYILYEDRSLIIDEDRTVYIDEENRTVRIE